jgi:hypothetical protein
MPQHDYEILNGTGMAVLDDINDVLQAIMAWNSGDPDDLEATCPYMAVVDVVTSTVKIRDAADVDWVALPFSLAICALIADSIAEETPAAGVDIDGLTIKDAGIALGSDADGDTYHRASSALVRLAKGTSGQRYTMNSGATAPEWVTPGASIITDYIKVTYEQSSKLNNILYYKNQWATRTLTKIVTDTTGAATLSSSRITLPAGTYHVIVRTELGNDDVGVSLKLYNYTISADVVDTNSNSLTGLTLKNYGNYLAGDFTVAASQKLELQHFLSNDTASPVAEEIVTGVTNRYIGVSIEFFKYE